MKIEVVRAWPRRFESVELELPQGSRVADALAAAGWVDQADTLAYAVHGVRVDRATGLKEGDRLELLRPLQVDPMDARRRRAQARKTPG
ncbi:RnfH family protein [Lysobacter koreensis]|uniref:UPF0125 protein ACFQZQ_02475 n=1 Tax=Lysobacter koreensis TaxID=266122 RepID=A0ABW2YIY6_9GAMM